MIAAPVAAGRDVPVVLQIGGSTVISRTPMRISLVGGGTDFAEYYRSNGGGAVVAAAIRKYVYVIVNRRFEDGVRLSYSKTEIVSRACDLQHPLVREALKLLGITHGIEIVSVSDIPSNGSGLGSSSAFTVGLLRSLHAWLGEEPTARVLAEEAVRIERELVRDPGGKQDQYIAAFGGLCHITFSADESVRVEPIPLAQDARDRLVASLMLFYTGERKSGSPILRAQIQTLESKRSCYDAMRKLADDLDWELRRGIIDSLGSYLDQNWQYKKRLQAAISSPEIDRLYGRARLAGATGGKIAGAGGGGFLVLCVPPERRDQVRAALVELREEPFQIDDAGTCIVYRSR